MSATAGYLPRRTARRRATNSLKIRAQDRIELIAQVEKGLSWSVVERFSRSSGLSISQIAHILRLPQRTLLRRKLRGRLDTSESERLIRLSSIFDQASGLFEGDRESALKWLQTPSRALGAQQPLQLIRSEIGAREVEDLIGRLEHGVFT